MSPIVAALVGSLVAGLGTGVGATPILIRGTWSQQTRRVMLAVSGGVMLSAACFSLLLPAFEHACARGHGETVAVLIVAIGTLVGVAALWMLHAHVPHAHFEMGRDGAPSIRLSRYWLFVLAIALHNLPEGLAVGVAYGGGAPAAGFVVMLGIASHNLLEGLAVAAALVSDGTRRWHAFAIALLTGFVEPVGGVIGAAAVGVSSALLPWGLAFAAGAMFFVVFREVLPEVHRDGDRRPVKLAAMSGFVAMMALALLVREPG